MTLHWWMHWFWVTSLLIIIGCSRTLLAAPQTEELQRITTDTELPTRQERAMYFTKTPQTASSTANPSSTNITDKNTLKIIPPDNTTAVNATTERIPPPLINWTSVTERHNKTTDNDSITTIVPVTTLLPVLKNISEENKSNVTNYINGTKRNFVKNNVKAEGPAESRTEKPLSLETEFLQTRIPPSIESSKRVIDPGAGGMDTGAIAGISFGALVLGALAGSTAFILYRRRYLNKPQTLNDKCSNPDSSGYLDDSTVRDNSEEMYSLDNDSFLNSLEAMTIQNYWTDTVKHTKL